MTQMKGTEPRGEQAGSVSQKGLGENRLQLQELLQLGKQLQ